MANCIGYERLAVGESQTTGPTTSIVQGGVRSAIFYVDPAAQGFVRWGPGETGTKADSQNAPTHSLGAPIYPGGTLILVGEGTIRNVLFQSPAGEVSVHAYYYDQVDVVDFVGHPGTVPGEAKTDLRIHDLLEELLAQVKRANKLLEVLAEEEITVDDAA